MNQVSLFPFSFVILLLRFVKYSCTSTQLNLAGLNSWKISQNVLSLWPWTQMLYLNNNKFSSKEPGVVLCMYYWVLETCWFVTMFRLISVKRKGKKKKDSLKEVAKESRVHPAILFLQCHMCLAEGLTMVSVFLYISYDIIYICFIYCLSCILGRHLLHYLHQSLGFPVNLNTILQICNKFLIQDDLATYMYPLKSCAFLLKSVYTSTCQLLHFIN